MSKTGKYDDSICASSDFEELSRIRDFVKKSALTYGFEEHQAQQIALAVDEACSNLIRHAFNFDKKREICIEIETDKNSFIVKVLDDGAPFNPLEVNPPDMKEYFRKYQRGGLGISIMRKVMDKILYQASNKKNPKNILKLIKNMNGN